MLKAKPYLLFMLVLVLLACDQIDEIRNKYTPQKNGEKVYEVARWDGEEYVYEKKTLDQISADDLTNGHFEYRGESGGLIVTDIRSEEDGELAKKYESDLFRDPEFISKYDERSDSDKALVVFNKKMLSYHPDLKTLKPNFFMDDYDVNWMCHALLESFHRLQQCDFSIGCQIEADLYFEKWCLRRIAELTSDESWCEKFQLSLENECYWSMAIQKRDKKICWKTKRGDIQVMNCIKDVAKFSQKPEICEEMRLWYEDRLSDKENGTLISEDLSRDFIRNCKKEVNFFDILSMDGVDEEKLFKDIIELKHCKKFNHGSNKRKFCEEYVYRKNDIKNISGCADSFDFPKDIGNCLASNFPIKELEEIEYNLDQSCEYSKSNFEQKKDIVFAGRVTNTGKNYLGLDYIKIWNTHHSSVSCGSLSCSSETPIENINPGDGIHMIGDKISWEKDGGSFSRCNITEIKKVFKP